EHSLEVEAEHAADIGIAVTAPDQPFGDVVNTLGMIQPVDPEPCAKPVELFYIRWQSLIPLHLLLGGTGIKPSVTADSDVLDADQFADVIHMVEPVLDRRRLLASYKGSQHGQPHHAALCRHLAKGFIGFTARIAGIERPAIRVTDGH